MALPGVIAVKATQRASESMTSALKNDLYVHKWTSTKGKGKKKREVEHELHINPVTVILAGVGAAAIAALGAGALWMSQRKLGVHEGRDMYRKVKVYNAVYKDVKVIDKAEVDVAPYDEVQAYLVADTVVQTPDVMPVRQGGGGKK